MLICLDAGHGGKDSGACGAYSKEKDVVLRTVKQLGITLENLGFAVIYTRTNDTYIKLLDRARLANKKNADLFLSIHCNSAVTAAANGTETLCYEKSNVAEYIQSALIMETGLRNRGIKIRRDLAVLNCTKMTAVLVELAFISNKSEEALLNNDAWISRNVTAIAKGICKCYSVPYIEQEVEMITETKMNIGGKLKNVKRILKDGENYVRLRDLESVVNISYDSTTKRVSVSPK